MKNEASYTVRFALVAVISALLIFSLGVGFTMLMQKGNSSTPLPVFNESTQIRFVIDPGHGGEDAGAVAADGTLEKDLNLQLAIALALILELNGNQAVLTRETDTLLYDRYNDLTDYTGYKKVYDLKNRLKIAEEKENSVYVGIHMNKFEESKYSGLQVYYSPNDARSNELALAVKDTVSSYLQPQNKRPVKKADSSIYILNRAQMPAVLIECGFMSNENELSLLKTKEYRKDLALCLFLSIVDCFN